ncbi:MAG TPA: glycerol-3-phosphate 1-O-acyltransferase PlsY [Vicinamibacterales bacterium]|jgi:glycerol-3-phosphate acyltransferase PlsY
MPNLWVIPIGYALGSIPFALLLGRWLGGIDLRRTGSGNLGAANAFRTTGPLVGLCILLLDVAKGAATVLLARRVGGGAAPAVAGVAAVVGHVYPIWLGFQGGKGVATACGAFALLAPPATAIASVAFLLTTLWTRYISLGSVVGTMLVGPIAYFMSAPTSVVIGALVTAAIIVPRHRDNLRRLVAGVEHRIRT